MKVLMISGDVNLLKEGSAAAERLALQRGEVERLDAVVWPQRHSVFHIFNLARKNRYDVITAQDPFWRGHIARHLAWLFGARLNLQVHFDLDALSGLRRIFVRARLRAADSIRVVSEKTKRQVEALGVKAPVRVLPVFVDVARFKELAPTAHEGKTILWIGRFEREKDPQAAIDVLKKVRAQGSEAKLVMLGAGSLAAELRRAAGDLPVEFPGWGDPAAYLPRADVVLSTSPYESYGASIIEALAAGVPVVARDVGVAREAGAIIAAPEMLADAVGTALALGERSVLKLPMLTREEWAATWKETL